MICFFSHSHWAGSAIGNLQWSICKSLESRGSKRQVSSSTENAARCELSTLALSVPVLPYWPVRPGPFPSLARGRKSRPGSNHQAQFENHKGGTTSLPVAATGSRSGSNEAQFRDNEVKSQQNCQRPQNWFSKKSKGLTAGGGALPGITCGPGIGDVLVKILRQMWWMYILIVVIENMLKSWKEFDCSEVWDGTSTFVKSEILKWFCFSVSVSKSKCCKQPSQITSPGSSQSSQWLGFSELPDGFVTGLNGVKIPWSNLSL